MFDELHIEPQEFVRMGDKILVAFRATGRGGESGIPVDVRLANVFTMKDGLVLEWHSYTSKAQALEALGVADEEVRRRPSGDVRKTRSQTGDVTPKPRSDCWKWWR